MKTKIILPVSMFLISVFLVSCGGNENNQMRFPPAQVAAYTVKQERASYYTEYPANRRKRHTQRASLRCG